MMWVCNTEVDIAGFWCSPMQKKVLKISIGNGFINFDFWCNVALGTKPIVALSRNVCIAPTKALSRNLILTDNT